MKVLLSAFFWFYLALSLMIFWFAVVPVWLLLLPFDRRRRFSHWYAWTWANHYVALSPFWRVHVHGRAKIRDDRTYVLVANHQSFGDIFVLYQLRKHFKWVAKDSVFLVPFRSATARESAHTTSDHPARDDAGPSTRFLRASSMGRVSPPATTASASTSHRPRCRSACR